MNENIDCVGIVAPVFVVFLRKSDWVFFGDDVVSMCNMSRPFQIYSFSNRFQKRCDVLIRFFSTLILFK